MGYPITRIGYERKYIGQSLYLVTLVDVSLGVDNQILLLAYLNVSFKMSYLGSQVKTEEIKRN